MPAFAKVHGCTRTGLRERRQRGKARTGEVVVRPGTIQVFNSDILNMIYRWVVEKVR